MQNKSTIALISWVSSSVTKSISMICIVFLLAACQQKTAEEYLQEAAEFSASGDSKAAVVALKNAVQLDSRSSKARFELGKIYLEIKNYESAEKELTRAKELGYSESELVPLLAQALQRTGANVELSGLNYDTSDLTNAEQTEVGFRKVLSLVQLNKTQEARELMNELLRLDTNTVYKGLLEGYQLVLDEKLPLALAKVEQMHERAPLNQDVLNFMARLYLLNGDSEKAANVYEEYVKVNPDDIEVRFSLASMLVEQKESERAEKHIDELLKIAGNNPFLNQLKGVVRAADSDYEAARLFSEKAISLGQQDPALRLIAGFASYQQQDFAAAIEHISVIAALLPDDHPALRILAASQLQFNMGDEASEVLSRVSEPTALDANLFSRAGYELIKSGNTKAAKQVIAQVGKISETSEDLTRLGVLKLSMNDIEGLVDLESAVEKAPESMQAKTILASAYLSTGQIDKAMALAKQWQKDEPSSVEGILLEAEVLQRQARFAEASVVLTKAIKLDGKNIPAKLSAIKLDILEKKLDSALVKTEALLKIQPNNELGLASYFALKNETNDVGEAYDRIRQAVSKNPENANLAILLARVALMTNNNEEAAATLRKIKPTRQALPAFWKLKGLALVKTNKTDEALDHYNKWAELYPNQEDAVLGQLLILDSQRAYVKGTQVATDFLRRKDVLQLKLMQSYFMILAGDARGSKKVLAAIDDKYHSLPFVRGIKARLAVFEGKGEIAVEDGLVSYSANKSSDNLFIYVHTLDAAGKRDESLKVIAQHVKDFPSDGKGKMLLAERQMGPDAENALRTYEEMLKDYPNNFVVLNNAAFLYLEADNLEKALEYSTRAFSIKPDNVAIADTHAQVLMHQGKTSKAVEVYNRVMSKDIRNEEINLNFIEALLKSEQTAKAKRRIEELEITTDEGKVRLAELQKQYIK